MVLLVKIKFQNSRLPACLLHCFLSSSLLLLLLLCQFCRRFLSSANSNILTGSFSGCCKTGSGVTCRGCVTGLCVCTEVFQLLAVRLPQSGDQMVETQEISAVLEDVGSNPAAICFGRGVRFHSIGIICIHTVEVYLWTRTL